MWEWLLTVLVPLAADPGAIDGARVRSAVAVSAARSSMEIAPAPAAPAAPTKKGAIAPNCPNGNCPVRR